MSKVNYLSNKAASEDPTKASPPHLPGLQCRVIFNVSIYTLRGYIEGNHGIPWYGREIRRTNNYSTPRKYWDSVYFLALLFLSSQVGHLEEWVLGSGWERERNVENCIREKCCLRSEWSTGDPGRLGGAACEREKGLMEIRGKTARNGRNRVAVRREDTRG